MTDRDAHVETDRLAVVDAEGRFGTGAAAATPAACDEHRSERARASVVAFPSFPSTGGIRTTQGGDESASRQATTRPGGAHSRSGVDLEDRVIRGDARSCASVRVGADAVEEGADLPLPLLQVGAEDRDAGRRAGPRSPRSPRSSVPGAGGRRRRRACCGPTGCCRAGRPGSGLPSTSSRLTGVDRHWPDLRPLTSRTREPMMLIPERHQPVDARVEDVAGEPARLLEAIRAEGAAGGSTLLIWRRFVSRVAERRENLSPVLRNTPHSRVGFRAS